MTHPSIRVAADGSPGSRRAFEWALEEADLRHCAVELVTAYQPGDDGDHAAARARAERILHATLDDIVAGRAELPLVSWQVVAGEPPDVLVRESAQSQLLVMGSHGVDSMMHSALGSVADTCARMADCPVVIIPPVGRAATAHEELVSSVEN